MDLEKNESSLLGIDEEIFKMKNALPIIRDKIIEMKAMKDNLSLELNEEENFVAGMNLEFAKVKEKRSLSESNFSNLRQKYENWFKRKFWK